MVWYFQINYKLAWIFNLSQLNNHNNREMELLLCLLLICNSFLVSCFVISIIVNMCIPILVLSLNNCVEKGMHLISATNILSTENAVRWTKYLLQIWYKLAEKLSTISIEKCKFELKKYRERMVYIYIKI